MMNNERFYTAKTENRSFKGEVKMNDEKQIVFRRRRVSFSQIPNTLIDDTRVSNIAKMLYITICRWIDAPNYQIYKSTLRKQMGIGSENTFDKYWKELKDKGYLIQYKMHVNGRYCYEYELIDEPQKNNTPKNEVLGNMENNTPNFEGVESEGCCKVGMYNNTDLHNTDLLNTDFNSSSPDDAGKSLDRQNKGIEKKEEEDKKKTDNQIDNSADIKKIMQHCQECSFKLQKRTVEKLIKTYSADTIIQAITTATESNTEIVKPGPYIVAVLNDMSRSKTVTVNITSKDITKQNKFNDFPQRDYKPDEMQSMEQRLLNKKNGPLI